MVTVSRVDRAFLIIHSYASSRVGVATTSARKEDQSYRVGVGGWLSLRRRPILVKAATNDLNMKSILYDMI